MDGAAATNVVVEPASRLGGHLVCPGDKSISHRYALLGALATGRTTITRYATGADCSSTLKCLRTLGVTILNQTGPDVAESIVEIDGGGRGVLSEANTSVDAGNSATTLRLLAGILAAHPFRTTLTGDPSLRRRPMDRVIKPLCAMGAQLYGEDGCPPLTINGGTLRGIEWTTAVPSAQVKSALLFAGLHANGKTTVRERIATRDHTERALARFGIEVEFVEHLYVFEVLIGDGCDRKMIDVDLVGLHQMEQKVQGALEAIEPYFVVLFAHVGYQLTIPALRAPRPSCPRLARGPSFRPRRAPRRPCSRNRPTRRAVH